MSIEQSDSCDVNTIENISENPSSSKFHRQCGQL